MPNLTQLAVQTIKRAHDSRAVLVPFNKTWEYLHTQYSIGKRHGRQLAISAQDWETIRDVVTYDTGIDLSKALPTGNRTEIAAAAINEKWADDSVEKYRILAASNGPIALIGGAIPPISGHVSWIDWRVIDSAKIPMVVVVENKEAITYWDNFNLPPELRYALAIYRGNDQSSNAVKNFLASRSTGWRAVYFPDYDPAGLVIANSAAHVDGLLIPRNPHMLIKESHTKRFMIQWARYSHSRSQLPEHWKLHWDFMGEHQVALPQEKLAALNFPLECIARTSADYP